MRTIFLALTLVLGLGEVQAMDLVVHRNQVFASGPLGDDLRKFEEVFSQPEIDTLVFLNSPGGDLWTGLRVGQLLAEKKVKTVIGGRCYSACALMFLGGIERTFSDVTVGTATSIGIHGAHSKLTKAILPEVQGRIFAYIKMRVGDKFNSEIINQALYDMDDPSAMLNVFDKKRAPNLQTFHCKGPFPSLVKCSIYPNEDGMSLGLLTSDVTTHVELPSVLAAPPEIFGIPLTKKLEDFDGYVRSRTNKHCDFEACKDMLIAHPSKGYNSAIAFPSAGFGFANKWGADTPLNMMIGAIYTCNHRNTRPVSLCTAAAVNEFDMAPWHEVAALSHTDGLLRLAVPSQLKLSNESTGGEAVTSQGIKTKELSTMTPNALSGVASYSTLDVAKSLKATERKPILIDVDATGQTIPSAISLLNAGSAFESAAEDSAFETRYRGLMKLLVPDLETPIVFFASSRETWTAANAAMRAVKWGYKNVGWYRGGMQAWGAEDMPLATTIIKAVVN